MYEPHRCSRWWYWSIYFLLDREIEHYHCYELWFAYCNTCNLCFSSLKFENGLKKHARNVARTKYGFIKLVASLFILNTRCDYVIPSDFACSQLFVCLLDQIWTNSRALSFTAIKEITNNSIFLCYVFISIFLFIKKKLP